MNENYTPFTTFLSVKKNPFSGLKVQMFVRTVKR